jgi:hypothetical protein
MTRHTRTQTLTKAQKAIRSGDPVTYVDARGIGHQTTARSDPYQIEPHMSNAGMWVIFIAGRSGYYELQHVVPTPSPEAVK